MQRKTIITMLIMALLVGWGFTPALAQEGDDEATQREIQDLRERLEMLEAEVAERDEAEEMEGDEEMESEEMEAEEEESDDGIHVGGAVRTQYSYEDYNDANSDRVGDWDLDTIRVNFDGEIGDVILSAEYRFYQYMDVVHHGWVGYDFSDEWHGRLGITQVPFGVLPYNSHSYFFDSTYYVGLEDDYDTGVLVRRRSDDWDLDFAFFKNDEMGGVDGFVDNRSDRYSYDVVGERLPGEGIFDRPAQEIAERDTLTSRVARHYSGGGWSGEVGLSGQYGGMEGASQGDIGDQWAHALHLVANKGNWNIQLQRAEYEYDLDSGSELLAVGAYSFFDTIPSAATFYTANVAYTKSVEWGPITSLTFYNDYSLMTDKSGGLEDDTTMNVLGVAVAAGGLYTYVDFVTAENQPFIGGSTGVDGGDTNHRFNINFGYYF